VHTILFNNGYNSREPHTADRNASRNRKSDTTEDISYCPRRQASAELQCATCKCVNPAFPTGAGKRNIRKGEGKETFTACFTGAS